MTFAPDWAGAINLQYDRPLTDRLSGFINANWAYRGDQYIAYDIQDKQSGYALLGVQVGVRTRTGAGMCAPGATTVSMNNTPPATSMRPFYFDDTLAQYQGQFLGPPRTYGVTLRMSF